MTTDWVYPSSLEELNAALQEERIEALEMRRRGDKKYYPATHCYRTPAKWDAHSYRYKLKEPPMDIETAYVTLQEASGIKKGDKVRVVRAATDHEMGWQNGWNRPMSETVGNEHRVTALSGGLGIKLDSGFNYPFFVLEKIKPAPIKVEDVQGYVCYVVPGISVTVGCTTLDAEEVNRIFEVWTKES